MSLALRQLRKIVSGVYAPVQDKRVPVIRSAAKATLLRRRSLLALQFGEGLLVAWLKNRREAVFAGHGFYDSYASMTGIDLFTGSNHSRPL